MLESRSDSIDRRGLQCILGTRVGGHDVGHLVDTVFTHLAEYRKEGAPTSPSCSVIEQNVQPPKHPRIRTTECFTVS